ncbi:hypothetical protein LK540_14365 [Massilia sp. IC2-278]|uniref:hypothetical protein n=1 Tax=Massilia sp. IC2-278 TaxID=2887200 RepID=UPI001E378ED2|nr:hypothetical protein [Massilia sp. IC2-278]MCC2961611.1 hypothetical protein [Massilia sp. IC2-278]
MKYRSTFAGAAALLLAAAAAAAAAPDPAYLPPPGLYQFDVVSDLTNHNIGGNTFSHETQDGATGDLNSRSRRKDGSSGSFAAKGKGPMQVCMPATRPGALPKNLAIDGCKASKGQVIGGQMVAVHSCPWGDMKITLRKVDARTWETTTQVVETVDGSDDAADEHPLREVYEDWVKNGSAEEKAEGRRLLAEARKYEAERKTMPKTVLAPADPKGAPLFEEKSVIRLTRLGDCKG